MALIKPRSYCTVPAASRSAQVRLNGADCSAALESARCFSAHRLECILSRPPPPPSPGRKQVLLNGQAEQVLRGDSQKQAPHSVTPVTLGLQLTKAALKRFSPSTSHVYEQKGHLEETKTGSGGCWTRKLLLNEFALCIGNSLKKKKEYWLVHFHRGRRVGLCKKQ